METESSQSPPEPQPPRVSIITPVYNQEALIRETAGSILAQSYRSFEWIVIDDGSTDGSAGVVEAIARENPQVPIMYGRQKNAGPATARNTGIAHARGELVLQVDGDDLLSPEALGVFVATLDANPDAALAYPAIQEFGTSTYFWPAEPWNAETLKKRNYVPICSMYRREAFDAAGGYRPEEGMMGDWGLWLSMLGNGEHGVPIQAPLFHYRRHAESWSHRVSAGERKRLAELVRKNRPALYGASS